METPLKIDDLGVPLFLETPIYVHLVLLVKKYLYIRIDFVTMDLRILGSSNDTEASAHDFIKSFPLGYQTKAGTSWKLEESSISLTLIP